MSCETCERLLSQFRELRESYTFLDSAFTDEKREKEKALEAVEKKDEELNALREEIRDNVHEKRMLVQQRDGLKDQIQMLEDMKVLEKRGADISRIRQEADRQIEALHSELKNATHRARDGAEKVESLERKVHKEIQERKHLQTEIKVLSERTSHAESQKDILQKQLSSLESDKLRSQDRIHQLSTELQELESDTTFQLEENRTNTAREIKRAEKSLLLKETSLQNVQREVDDLRTKIKLLETQHKASNERQSEETAHKLQSENEKQRDLEETLRKSDRGHERRISTLQEEISALKSECDNVRQQRDSLEANRFETTSKCDRLQKVADLTQRDLQLTVEEQTRLKRELDIYREKTAEGHTNEAKLTLMDVQLQYKQLELTDAKKEKDAILAERAQVVSGMQNVMRQDKKVLKDSQKDQRRLLLITQKQQRSNQVLSDKYQKLKLEFDDFKSNIQVRQEAQNVLGGGEFTFPSGEGVEPSGILQSLSENYQKTKILSDRYQAVAST